MFFLLEASQPIEITKTLVEQASKYADGFGMIGRGIGSIMLLVVVFYYVTSILDGGKFQMKMLLPLLIYLIVCQFSIISKPVISFTSTITSSLVEELQNAKTGAKSQLGCSESATYDDMNNMLMSRTYSEPSQAMDEKLGKTEVPSEESMSEQDATSSLSMSALPTQPEIKKERGLSAKISTGILMGGANAINDFEEEASGEVSGSDGSSTRTTKNLGWMGLLMSIVSIVCELMSKVLSAFGAVMTATIVAFGPITFAFAIFPGQAGTVKSWFIRLCQFSLWSPLCALVDCFSVHIFTTLANAGIGAGGFLMGMAVAVCNLVVLTSVPTIASMIIEGASGAVSLSQGLQTIGGAVTTSASVLAGAGKIMAGTGGEKMTQAKDTVNGLKSMGLAGMAKSGFGHGDSGESGFKGIFGDAQQRGFKERMEKMGKGGGGSTGQNSGGPQAGGGESTGQNTGGSK